MNLKLLVMSVLMMSMVSCGKESSITVSYTEERTICSGVFNLAFERLAGRESEASFYLQVSEIHRSEYSYIALSNSLRRLEMEKRYFRDFANINCVSFGTPRHGSDVNSLSTETIERVRHRLRTVGRL